MTDNEVLMQSRATVRGLAICIDNEIAERNDRIVELQTEIDLQKGHIVKLHNDLMNHNLALEAIDVIIAITGTTKETDNGA